MFDIPPQITIGELYELLTGSDFLSGFEDDDFGLTTTAASAAVPGSASASPFLGATSLNLHLSKPAGATGDEPSDKVAAAATNNASASASTDAQKPSESLPSAAVSAAVTPPALLSLTSESPADGITHAQIVNAVHDKDTYTLLLKFRTHALAEEFRLAFNGRRFNELEPEICKLAYVHCVEFDEPAKFAFPFKVARRRKPSQSGLLECSCETQF